MKKNTLFATIGIIFGIIIVIIIITPKTPNEYVPTETTPAQIESTSVSYEYELYTDNKNDYAIKIIDGWTKVISENSIQFIERNTSTGVEITAEKYNPSINNYNDKTIPIENNTVLTSFVKYSNSEILYEYTKQDNQNTYNYIVYKWWDYEKIITFKFTLNSKFSEKMLSQIKYMLDSIYITSNNKIPSGYYSHYSKNGNFEFLIKDNWQTKDIDNGYMMYDSTKECNITITMTPSTGDFKAVNQIAYTNFIMSSRKNFVLNTYSNTGSNINAEATFMNNNRKYYMLNYMMATGTYEISVIIEFPAERLDNSLNDTISIFTKYMIFYK